MRPARPPTIAREGHLLAGPPGYVPRLRARDGQEDGRLLRRSPDPPGHGHLLRDARSGRRIPVRGRQARRPAVRREHPVRQHRALRPGARPERPASPAWAPANRATATTTAHRRRRTAIHFRQVRPWALVRERRSGLQRLRSQWSAGRHGGRQWPSGRVTSSHLVPLSPPNSHATATRGHQSVFKRTIGGHRCKLRRGCRADFSPPSRMTRIASSSGRGLPVEQGKVSSP